MARKQDLPVLAFASRQAWEAWLDEHHESSDGIWLKFAKKASGIETVSHAQALEEALRHGWIDGQAAKFDDDHWLQRFTPRRPASRWSRINRDKATQLIERGAMTPAGMRQVELAKEDGRWDSAYESQSTAAVPDDLQRELDRHPRARELFTALDSRNRYAILYRVQEAKRPETRARRISRYVAMLDGGETIYPRRS